MLKEHEVVTEAPKKVREPKRYTWYVSDKPTQDPLERATFAVKLLGLEMKDKPILVSLKKQFQCSTKEAREAIKIAKKHIKRSQKRH